jgi:hypothetical protein
MMGYGLEGRSLIPAKDINLSLRLLVESAQTPIQYVLEAKGKECMALSLPFLSTPSYVIVTFTFHVSALLHRAFQIVLS